MFYHADEHLVCHSRGSTSVMEELGCPVADEYNDMSETVAPASFVCTLCNPEWSFQILKSGCLVPLQPQSIRAMDAARITTFTDALHFS